MHGGLSTGPRTEEGRRRLSELGKARALAAVAADIEQRRAYDVEMYLRDGIARELAESLAGQLAEQRRCEHAQYEATIARYLALGHTRAYARRFMRMAACNPERARWLYRLRWGREFP
jgi:hypothetical protein